MTTPKTAKHTPTPWKIEANIEEGGVNHLAVTARHATPDYMVCSITPMRWKREIDDANAAHIVNCVNNHERLVEALKDLMLMHDDAIFISGRDDEAMVEKTLNQARAALKEVE